MGAADCATTPRHPAVEFVQMEGVTEGVGESDGVIELLAVREPLSLGVVEGVAACVPVALDESEGLKEGDGVMDCEGVGELEGEGTCVGVSLRVPVRVSEGVRVRVCDRDGVTFCDAVWETLGVPLDVGVDI